MSAPIPKSTLKCCILFVLILALAAFFRFYRLETLPPGLYPDIAINGNDAIHSLQDGRFKLFYPENNGREGLMIWLIAASFSLFGVSVYSIKIVAATAGVLTVLGVYLLSRQLFEKRNEFAALLAAFFLAVLFWHVNFSRIGFRVILMPLALVFAFYFFIRGFKTKRLYNHIVGGLFFAAGFYTYTGFRLAVLLLFATLAGWFFYYWKADTKVKYAKVALATLAAIFAAALPIGLYFLGHPADFLGRAGQTSVFAAQNQLLALGNSLVLHLGMFNVYGDGNWRHNYAGSPELFWPVGILFLIGFAYSLKRLLASAKSGDLGIEFNSHLLLSSWFAALLLPGVLTSEGAPHALRTFGTVIPAVIFAGLGGQLAYSWLSKKVKRQKIMLAAGIVFLAFVAGNEYRQYFVLWANEPELAGSFTQVFSKEGELLAELSRDKQTAVIANEPGVAVPYPDGIPMPAQTIVFMELADCANRFGIADARCATPYSQFILPDRLNEIKINQSTVIMPMKNDPALLNAIRQAFPRGEIKQNNNITYYETY